MHQDNTPTITSSPSAPHYAPDRVRIVSTPGTCGGRPRIDGHRITVEDVAIWYERLGMSPDEIVSDYPSLNLSEVHAALACYFEHRRRIDYQIEAGRRTTAELRAKSESPLQMKLRRRAAANGANDSLPPG